MPKCKYLTTRKEDVTMYETFFGGLTLKKERILPHRGTVRVPLKIVVECTCKEAITLATTHIRTSMEESNLDVPDTMPIPMNCGDGFTLWCDSCDFKEVV